MIPEVNQLLPPDLIDLSNVDSMLSQNGVDLRTSQSLRLYLDAFKAQKGTKQNMFGHLININTAEEFVNLLSSNRRIKKNKKILNINGIIITKQDIVTLLSDNGWLNDNMVNTFLSCYQKVDEQTYEIHLSLASLEIQL